MKVKKRRYREFARDPAETARLKCLEQDPHARLIRFRTCDLSDEDRVHAWKIMAAGKIIAFGVQYECFVGDRWREISRIDCSPNEKLNRHVFHPKDNAGRKIAIAEPAAITAAEFYEYLRGMKRDYETYKEAYIIEYERSKNHR